VRSSVICSDDTLPRVEYEDIVSGTGRLNKDIYAKQSIKSGIAFHQGDVLYGKLRPYLQNWLLPTFDGLAVGDFWVLQPQNADSSFLYRLIQSRQFDEVANQSTGTKMPRADWKLVSKTVFSIPSNISEQAAIGTYFTALDSLITLHQRQHFLHSTPDISLSVRLIHPFYTSSWEQRKFEEIAVRSSVICSDDTLPRVEYEDIVSGTGRLNKDIYAKQSIKSGIAFHQGDVLYGKLRPYLQNWLLPTFDGLAVGDFWVLQPQNADSSFLYRLIQSRQFDEVANQSTGTKMPRADWKLVSKTVFSIPSNISEQAAIGTYFTALDSLITLHQRKGKAAVSGCSNDANNSKGVCCKARDFGYKCHKKDEPNRFDA
jgi:type I restriction enzyme S subunit